MAIVDEVSRQMKEALRAKQERRLAALRSIRAAFLNEMKRDGSDTLADDICTGLLRRLEKQRKESIEAFEGAGREERAEARGRSCSSSSASCPASPTSRPRAAG
jgi:uncharacterized protein YqeY